MQFDSKLIGRIRIPIGLTRGRGKHLHGGGYIERYCGARSDCNDCTKADRWQVRLCRKWAVGVRNLDKAVTISCNAEVRVAAASRLDEQGARRNSKTLLKNKLEGLNISVSFIYIISIYCNSYKWHLIEVNMETTCYHRYYFILSIF